MVRRGEQNVLDGVGSRLRVASAREIFGERFPHETAQRNPAATSGLRGPTMQAGREHELSAPHV